MGDEIATWATRWFATSVSRRVLSIGRGLRARPLWRRVDEIEMFVLTREWRDMDDGTRLVFWGATAEGAARVVIPRDEPVFFVTKDARLGSGRREQVALKAMDGRDVDAVKFATRRASLDERDRIRGLGGQAFESDVKPSDRFLMERFVTGCMRVRGHARRANGFVEIVDPARVRGVDAPPPRPLRLAALDIETDGAGGPVLSIAVAARGEERVWMVGDDLDEASLLREAFHWIARFDPDVLAGWSVVEFDLATLERRAGELRVPFDLGRNGERARVLEGNPPVLRCPGRVALDGPHTLRSATYSFESLRLGDVANELLGRGKKIAKGVDPVEEIRRMYREDRAALAEYNLEDCRLVLDIVDAAGLLDFAIDRQRLTGLPIDKAGGSVAAFDHLYLPRLHRAGYVAPDVGGGAAPEESPGGAVLESAPGFYDNVVLLDFRSLYPSIMRTWNIDPLGLVLPGDDRIEGFEGATFAREGAILPALLSKLWEARSAAREQGRAAMSTAIKILMNSFYGVLGTPGCRFFDPRLVSSITLRGHEVIERTRSFIEARGSRVIYGDTDSLFVLVGGGASEAEARAFGERTARELNEWWRDNIQREHRLESRLELRFEHAFLRFLMPTLRGSERGTKKRYAGSIRKKDGSVDIVIKGLEAVRTDWTPLARETQRELIRRVLTGEAWEAWLANVRREVLAGKLDDKLVYKKRLRRDLDDYARAGSGAPAHVVAARQLEVVGRDVEYVVTIRGPEPLEKRSAPIDYTHYVEKQLAAACDSILPLLGTSFDRVAGSQLTLF